MTASWPSGLSTKLFATSGYSEDVMTDPTVRTTMDSGPPKMRPRFTAVPYKFTGNIDALSSAEVDILLDFYRNDCAWGSLPFTWVHPRSGAGITYLWTKFPAITPTDNSPIVFTASLNLIQLPT